MAKEAPVILVADRQLADTRPIRVELRRRGARVFMANVAEAAVRIAEQVRPDLFILDDELGLEGGPGDLAGFFRSVFPDAEIILLTSQPAEAARSYGLGLHFHGHKPIGHDTMIELVETALPDRLQPRTAGKATPCTVLCVDDDKAVLSSMSRILGRHGYKVCAFEDPDAAFKAIPDVAPDLAILDVKMPGMDGRELARQIRKEYRTLIPLVMLSGYTSCADMAAGYRHGADYFLSKPCEAGRLLDVVDYYAGDLDVEERQFLESQL